MCIGIGAVSAALARGGGGGGGSDHTAVLGNLGTREVCMLKHIGN